MGEIYCKYKGDLYRADIDGKKIEITSEVYVDGFGPYVDILGNKHFDIYMKEVEIKEVDLLFEQKVLVQYKGIYFEPFAGKITASDLTEDGILLFTASEDEAQQFGFAKKEQFVFVKKIRINEVDQIKVVKKPIATFKNEQAIEEIIKKTDIRNWLTVIH